MKKAVTKKRTGIWGRARQLTLPNTTASKAMINVHYPHD
jgi:hypothetical protein